MERLSLNHLHDYGGSGGIVWCSLQQLQCQPHQVQDETSTSKIMSSFLEVHLQETHYIILYYHNTLGVLPRLVSFVFV